MPIIYLKKELYDAIIRRGDEPSTFVNLTVEAALERSGKQPSQSKPHHARPSHSSPNQTKPSQRKEA